MMLESSTDIAIIGMSALFPGAKDLRAYWQNILNKVDAVEDAPDEWAAPYFDPDSKENDRIYSRKGGFLGKLAQFNPFEFGIMPNSVDGGEPDHFLALKLSWEALKDAGYIDRSFNREKTGIILGRGTYFNRGYDTLLQHGQIVDQTLDLLRQLHPELDAETLANIRKQFKASLPPLTAEMAPGLVPNVITGRIANRLNLMGPNYLIDAACASSLIAVELAIKELLSGRCDMVITGGVHASTPPQINMIFCQLGSLSHDKIQPFDSNAAGTVLGEGLGMLVLKRLQDAERDGDRIYAVVKSVGCSSDGKALGLLAPRLEGEVLALQRAYNDGNIDPATVGMVEAHGTGIPLGDQTEIRSLTQVFGQRQEQMPHCALGSVKSMIGHCLPAAGAAGLIKAALALYHKILPPTLCDQVNPALEIEKTPFYINTEARPWIHGNQSIPRRAGINSFGFGGINTHAILEEYSAQQSSLLHQQWPSELLIFSADDRSALLEHVDRVQQVLQASPQISLANLAYTLSTRPFSSHRLAIVAKDVLDLQMKLNQAVEKLQGQKNKLQTRNGIYYTVATSTANLSKTAFLFPGEGSQYPNMLADLCLYFPKVRAWFDFLDATFSERRANSPSHLIFPPPTSLTEAERTQASRQLFDMDVASETVFTASMALHELLSDLGVRCDVMVGHSTGENAALIASGTVKLGDRMQLMSSMRHLNQIYRNLEVADSIPTGALLTVGAIEPSFLQQIVDEFAGRLHLAMDNCPNQVVLFGNEADIDAAAQQLKAAGGICTLLPFDRAYHTSLFAPVGNAFLEFYNKLDVGASHTPLYSCATAAPFPVEAEAIRSLAARQWSSQVRFQETIGKLYEQGVTTFVEVGPSSNLTAFVDDTLHDRNYLAIASNSQRRSGLEQIQHLLARLFTNGNSVDLSQLYGHRELTLVNLDTLGLDTVSQKPSPVLNMTMPTMRLTPEFAQTLREKWTEKRASGAGEAIALSTPESYQEAPSTTHEQAELVTEKTENQLITYAVAEALFPETDCQEVDAEYAIAVEDSHPIANIPTQTLHSSVVHAHFDLMQEFLSSQARVMTTLISHLTNSPPAQEAASLDVQTRNFASLPPALFPLLGQILEQDAQHLYCERCFDMSQDIFLHDHTLGGQVSDRHPELFPLPVIPFTLSMEILAEAATCLVGSDKVAIALHDLRSYRWLSLDRGHLTLSIRASLQPQTDAQAWDVRVQLFQVGAGTIHNEHLVFEGMVHLKNEFEQSPTPLDFHLDNPSSSRWQEEDLYRTGMFHGPRFQSVKHIRQWGQQGIEAQLQTISTSNFFSHISLPAFEIDAGLLDAAGQLVGYWVAEQIGTDFNVFPFQVRALHLYSAPLPPQSLVLCRGLIGFTSDRQTEASFDFLDATGRVIARLEGWQDRFFSVPQKYCQCRLHPQSSYLSEAWMQAETQLILRRIEPFPEHFLDDSWSIWKRVLAHLMLNELERKAWYELPEKGPRRTDWLLGRIAAKDAVRQWAKQTYNLELAPIDIEILADELGKPFARCLELEAMGVIPDISISHSRGYVVAAIAAPGQRIGIDIESLDFVRSHDITSAAFRESELQLLPQPEDEAIIGFWCAKEAAAKAKGTGLLASPMQWLITQYSSDGQWLTVNHSGDSFAVKLWQCDRQVLAICRHS